MKSRGAHIAIDTVTHQYRRAQSAAIVDVSLEIAPGECAALVGRSGCGKSTLLHIICGLTRPSRGQVLIDGARVSGPSPDWVMMFQAPSLFPWMSVAQNIALGLRFSGRARESASRVAEMLELVELDTLADRNVQDLSGGQQQRVALARSLAPGPEVLLLDEPFSALDAFTRHALQREVRRIAQELRITLVFVTHDISEAVMMADRAYLMSANPGRLAGCVDIGISGARQPASTEFAAARERLVSAYESVTGMDIAQATPIGARRGGSRPTDTGGDSRTGARQTG